tara:strand:- start:3835 stop:4554 length:720 start_codon:yes stop_codon:yes gene_type:complete
MENQKKIKIFLGISYLTIICVFLWLFFNTYSLNEITSYNFIRDNRNDLIEIKNSNFFLISILFIISTIIWVLLLGFGTPICLLAGFIFGKWIGTLFTVLGLSIGATLLYLISNFFFKDLIEKSFSKKFNFLKEKFKNNEFIFFLIYRFIGGIPFFISNMLPSLFNVKVSNFFFGTLIGLIPQLFVWVSLGNGFEKIISENVTSPSFFEIISSKDIYLPIFGFTCLVILSIILKNRFVNK